MHIALLQMRAVPGDVSANLACIAKAVAKAAGQGADLLIAPELATVGYGAGDTIRDLAESPNGAQIADLGAIAAEQNLAIISGFPERDGSQIYDSAVFTDGHAKPVIYRKSHLYGDYERGLFTAAPPATVIIDWRGLKVGLLICYDVEFSQNVRRLTLDGAELVAVPTALPSVQDAEFVAEKLVPRQAHENCIFIAYANHTGSDDRFIYAGLSRIVAPDGQCLDEASMTEERLIFAELDLSKRRTC